MGSDNFVGNEMYNLIKKLFPICRSITGNGVRETLGIIKEKIPLEIHEIPTGRKIFDWDVPKEWNIRDAYVKNSKGEKIIDFKISNLHVLNYSKPVKTKIRLDELKKHLHTLPEQPEVIPYLTSYYKEEWGFCISQKQYDVLKDDTYEVVIDSSLTNGSLTYGELYLQGSSKEEILLSCYVCHPSMCNDNLSGIALVTQLAKILQKINTYYSYRFLFIPETIGAITWLSQNEDLIKNIRHGLVVTCVGDSGSLTYKKTRKGNASIDNAVIKVLEESGQAYHIVDFFPGGSDERQFSSPGFDLPVGSLMRTMYAKFPEYHTSADNMDFVSPKYLLDSMEKYLKIIEVLENDVKYVSTNPKCEPQLGKRGLYSLIGGQKNANIDQMAIFWLLNFSDGNYSIRDIVKKSKMDETKLAKTAEILVECNLLRKLQ
jgi:aminopeptidase-like protein